VIDWNQVYIISIKFSWMISFVLVYYAAACVRQKRRFAEAKQERERRNQKRRAVNSRQ